MMSYFLLEDFPLKLFDCDEFFFFYFPFSIVLNRCPIKYSTHVHVAERLFLFSIYGLYRWEMKFFFLGWKKWGGQWETVSHYQFSHVSSALISRWLSINLNSWCKLEHSYTMKKKCNYVCELRNNTDSGLLLIRQNTTYAANSIIYISKL